MSYGSGVELKKKKTKFFACLEEIWLETEAIVPFSLVCCLQWSVEVISNSDIWPYTRKVTENGEIIVLQRFNTRVFCNLGGTMKNERDLCELTLILMWDDGFFNIFYWALGIWEYFVIFFNRVLVHYGTSRKVTLYQQLAHHRTLSP